MKIKFKVKEPKFTRVIKNSNKILGEFVEDATEQELKGIKAATHVKTGAMKAGWRLEHNKAGKVVSIVNNVSHTRWEVGRGGDHDPLTVFKIVRLSQRAFKRYDKELSKLWDSE